MNSLKLFFYYDYNSLVFIPSCQKIGVGSKADIKKSNWLLLPDRKHWTSHHLWGSWHIFGLSTKTDPKSPIHLIPLTAESTNWNVRLWSFLVKWKICMLPCLNIFSPDVSDANSHHCLCSCLSAVWSGQGRQDFQTRTLTGQCKWVWLHCMDIRNHVSVF